MTNSDRTELFETMPIKKAVIKQIVPAILSQMISLIYTLVDTLVVGLLNNPVETASVTVAVQFFILSTAISNLFGVGGAATLAQSLGRKRFDSVKRISTVTVWFSVLAGLTFSIVTFVFMNPIAHIIGATDVTYINVSRYLMWTVVFGAPMSVASVSMANLVRAEGNASIASFGTCLGGVMNMILDPIFVLPQFLGMGAVGAGMATCFSNWISCAFFLVYILFNKKTILSINPKHLKYTKDHLGEILTIGVPAAVQYALTVVSAAALVKFVSAYPTEAVAGLGIARKLVESPLYFAIGVAAGLLPLLSYNYASGDQQRRKDAFRFGCLISLGCSLLFLILFEGFAPFFARLFIRDAVTVGYASRFLRILVLAQPLVAINYPMIIHFQAMGKVKESLICSVLRKGTLDIPLLFIADMILPLYGLMAVQLVVDFISFIMAMWLYRRINRQLDVAGQKD